MSKNKIIIKMYDDWEKDKIFDTPSGNQYIVLKSYKYTWWRKLLNIFGIKFHNEGCVKVKLYGMKQKVIVFNVNLGNATYFNTFEDAAIHLGTKVSNLKRVVNTDERIQNVYLIKTK